MGMLAWQALAWVLLQLPVYGSVLHASAAQDSWRDLDEVLFERRVVHKDARPSRALQACVNVTSPREVTLVNCGLSGTLAGLLASLRLQNVTSLDLSSNSLTGAIPPSLGNLSQLQSLSLAGNQLSGSLPEALGSLRQLTRLDLSANQFTGSVPSSLAALSQLQSLKLSSNQLAGPVPDLSALWQLTVVDLSNNQLVGPLPSSLGGLPLLQQLLLSQNQLSGPIPESFGQLLNLTTLSINSNLVSGPLPSALRNWSMLTKLDCGINRLTGPVPPWLGSLKALTYLDLSFNQLSGPMPETLGALQNLEVLQLNHNRLLGPIPAALGSLKLLSGVLLDNNEFAGPLPIFLFSLPRLDTLGLSANQFEGPIPNLGNLSQILRLYLYGNRLSGPIPTSICQLQSLQMISLWSNQLTGPIPPCIGNLSALFSIRLSGNQLTGPIPASLGNLPDMYELFLNSNNLEGSIPSSLGELPKMQLLHLSRNRLSGSLPPQLAQLPLLDELSLDFNQLSGPLPQFRAMRVLDLTSNMLSGTVNLTSCQSKCTVSLGSNRFTAVAALPANVSVLDLSQNLLQGAFPPAILQQAGLIKCDLSSNPLSTSLPAALGTALPNLQELRLQNCNLTGQLPSSLLALPNLTTLHLQDNPGLGGSFPDVPGPLQVLKAGNCSFTDVGLLPSELVELDLSHNQLTALPPTLESLQSLASLNLANNLISSWPGYGVHPRDSLQGEGTLFQHVVWANTPPLAKPLNMPKLLAVDLSNNPLEHGARELVCSFLYLPSLVSFSCANCGLTGPVTTLIWINSVQFWEGRSTETYEQETPTQGFPKLLTLDLSNNNITGMPPTPPPQLGVLDLSNNQLGPDGLPRVWFNEDGSSSLANLLLAGNPSLQLPVAVPATAEDGGCKRISQLTAKVNAFLSVKPGVECTTLCPSGQTTYWTDVLDPTAMCRCAAGWNGSATTCTPCPPDTYSVAVDALFGMSKVCLPCPKGSSTRGASLQGSLDACLCPVGSYLDMTEGSCVRCDLLYPLRTTAAPGQTSSAACRCNSSIPGIVTKAERAQLDDGAECGCAAGFFMNWKEMRCQSCCAGQLCPGDLRPPQVLPGFWADTAFCYLNSSSCPQFSGHSIFACFDSKVCVNGTTCAEGRGGKACSLCNPGWFGGPNGPCRWCQANQVTSIVGLVAALFLVWPLAGALHVVNRFLEGERHAGMPDQPAALGLRSAVRRQSLALPGAVIPHMEDEEDNDVQAREVWLAGCITGVFQIFVYLQLVSVMTKVEPSLPPLSTELFGGTNQGTTSVYEIGGVACLATQQSAGLELALRWGFPFVAVAFAAVSQPFCWATGWLLSAMGRSRCFERMGRGLANATGRDRPVALGAPLESVGRKLSSMDWRSTLEVIMMACSSYFVNILVSNGLLHFTCMQSPNGRFTVKNFPHVECPWGASTDTKEWWSLLGPALVYNLVFVFLIPIASNWYVFKQVVGNMAETMAATGCAERGIWGIFCDDFRDSHVHWSLVVVIKDMLINLISIAMVAFPDYRRLMVAGVTSLYALATMRERPYQNTLNNLLEAWISNCVAAMALLLTASFPDSQQDALLVIIFVLAVCGPVVIFTIQGLATHRRTKWLAPHCLHPVTRVWRKRRASEIAGVLASAIERYGAEQVLERLDNSDFCLLNNHLLDNAALIDHQSPETLQAVSTNLTVAHLRRCVTRNSLTDVERARNSAWSSSVVPSAPPSSSAMLVQTRMGKSLVEEELLEVEDADAESEGKDDLLPGHMP